MEASCFMNKQDVPTEENLKIAIGNSYHYWTLIKNYVKSKQPQVIEDWNFPGTKYGWSFRIKDKKRTLIYFLPQGGSFRVAFVFGDKALDKILKSNISPIIKTELQQAVKYAEGRGIRIPIENEDILPDIYTLADIKMQS